MRYSHVCVLDPGLDIFWPHDGLLHGAHLPGHPGPVEGEGAEPQGGGTSERTLAHVDGGALRGRHGLLLEAQLLPPPGEPAEPGPGVPGVVPDDGGHIGDEARTGQQAPDRGGAQS